MKKTWEGTRNENKMYCRLYGCYEALDGGELSDALEDFTGGVNEPVEMADYRDNDAMKDALFERMSECLEHKALMSAAIPVFPKSRSVVSRLVALLLRCFPFNRCRFSPIKRFAHVSWVNFSFNSCN